MSLLKECSNKKIRETRIHIEGTPSCRLFALAEIVRITVENIVRGVRFVSSSCVTNTVEYKKTLALYGNSIYFGASSGTSDKNEKPR